MVDFKVVVYEGSYHDVDSSEMSFKLAARKAFKAAMEQAKPALLEEQRLWVAFKEKSCAAYSTTSAFGREGQAIGFFACRGRVLTDRIEQLKSLGSDY